MSNVSILEELEDDETPFVQPDDELCLQISQQVKNNSQNCKKMIVILLWRESNLSAIC